MLLVSQAANGSLSARRLPSKPPGPSTTNPYPLFANPRLLRRRLALSGSGADQAPRRAAPTPAAAGEGPSASSTEDPVLVRVADEGVPLEGVIQIEKPGDAAAESKLVSYAYEPYPVTCHTRPSHSRGLIASTAFVRRKLGLLAGGDVFCLLLFSAIGRFSHGLPVLDAETFKTADPFIAGWLLSAYLLGGFGDDAKGRNGVGSAVITAAKSWAVGIPLGLAIRAVTSGHLPPTPFILVTMGSTGVLLTAWRALVSQLFSNQQKQQDDVYRRGSPFELFELLTSLVRRW
ncbi:hypothetical protein Zm00014a_010501 [Zea mays]|uniref:Uncharacterized protein n=2 Tax=Zea mays TaxID=4577 RepID=A0A317YJR9_MAIZE|nr:hypothetical protein Zm00014a_010501 [Zea mays]